MGRLVLFVAFLIGLVLLMNLKDFKTAKVNHEPFDFEKTKTAYEVKKAQMNKPKEEAKEVEVVEVVPFEVALDTPQLKNGSKLYKKCVVCHGKLGQGKKSQKAPAIGGQYPWYLEQSVWDIKTGKRINKVMLPYVKKLTRQEVKDLAAYITKLPPMGKLKAVSQ